MAYKQCLADCLNASEPDCYMSCYQQHPGGIEAFGPRWACVEVFCGDSDACGDLPLPPCELCLNAQCAEPYVELLSDPAGYLLWSCYLDCSENDQACVQACIDDYPSAQSLFEAFFACVSAACGAECG